MAQFVTLTDKNFSKGINQLSAESQLQPGYVEDILNADAEPEGFVSKRKGQETHQSVPVRVTRMTQTPGAPGTVTFYLDSSIDVSSSVDVSQLRSSPLFVYGRTQLSGAYDFTTSATGRYYTVFVNDVRLAFPVGLNQTAVYAADAHGFQTDALMVGTSVSTSENNRDNDQFIPSAIAIDTTTYNVTVTADNAGPGVLDTYAYVLDNSNQSGLAYTQGGINPAPGAGYDFFTITAATHQLANTDILVQVYDESTPGTLGHIFADSVTNTAGDIEVRFTPSFPGTTVRCNLRAIPAAKTREGTALAGATVNVVCTGLTTPFLIAQAFLEVTPGVWELVLPDFFSVDSTTSEATVTFTNVTASDARFRVLWAEAEVRTNQLSVTEQVDSVSPADTATGATTDLELTIWGLDHGNIYANPRDGKPGWVTALDSYRSEGEGYLCATLGWNLFREAFRISEGSTYGLVQRWPRLRQRASATRILAPLFHGTGDTVERTRGGYTILGGESGWAKATSVAYSGTPGLVTVTVSTPSRALALNSSGSEADLYLPEETNTSADLLSIRFSVWREIDGDWPVTAVDFSSPTQVVFIVRIPYITSADYNFTNQGEAGIFSDIAALSLADVTKGYLPAVGDVLRSTSFDSGVSLVVQGVRTSDTGSNVIVGPVTQTTNIPNGQLVTFSHTGAVLALRDDNPLSTLTYENIVRGDVLTITGQASRRTVDSLFLTAGATGTLVVGSDGGESTFTLSSGDTAPLQIGQVILVSKAGVLSGEWRITSVESITSFMAEPTGPLLTSYADRTGVAFTLLSGQLQLSMPGTFEDFEDSSVTVETNSRLVPAEYPTSADALPPAAAYNTEHLAANSYGNQPLVRTAMANDSMFATNYSDPLQKWDGTNIQRAGLPKWTPAVLVQKDTSGGTITVSPGKTIAGARTGAVFTATTTGEIDVLSVGQEVVGSDGVVYTIAAVNAVTKEATLTSVPVAAITSLRAFGLATYRYYVRADAVDANGYTLATASYGSEDLRVRLTESAAILLRISTMPQWRGLSYDRLRVRIYRTQATGAAPFFKVGELDMPFAYGPSFNATTLQSQGDYIDFRDATADETLNEKDPLSGILGGSGAIGDVFRSVEAPPPAKYITTIGNQAAYANIKSWPRVDINVIRNAAVASPVLAESWVLRKDSSDTGTATAPNQRYGYRFIAGTAANLGTVKALSGTNIATGTDFFDVDLGAGIGRPAIGGWIYLFRNTLSATPRSIFNGWWLVTAHPAANTVRVRCPGMTASVVYNAANDPNAAVITTSAAAPTDTLLHVPVYISDDDYNILTVNGNTADFVARVLYRLAAAVNATMRQGYTDISAGVQQAKTFTPWATALAGNQLGGARLQLEFPVALPTTPELQLGVSVAAAPAGFEIFGNDTPRAATAAVGARTLIRSSRVLLSTAGYPELVDNPFTDSPQVSTTTVVDINPADGQDITGIVPFFGESAFGGAMTSGQLVVFKTDSIYLLDPATRGLTKIESQGVGCSAPGSIAATRQGVIFAHTSGLYRITKTVAVEPIGANLDRFWQLKVDKSPESFAVMQAHNYTASRRYRFFWPSQDDAGTTGQTPRNSNVFSYDYTPEMKGEMGGWSRYDNHNLTNACNLTGEAYAGTWAGRVVRFLQTEEAESYRDEGQAISMQATFRAQDFGDEASRKKLLHLLLGFRLPVSSDGSGVTLRSVLVEQAQDLKDNFVALDSAVIAAAGPRDGLSSEVLVKQQTLRYSPAYTKAIYHQIRISDATLSAPVQIVSLGYRVTALSTKGTTQAANAT
jgi:hypothetical protein